MIPRTHVFAVAVEDYQDTTFQTVVYAEQDAQGFVQAWQELGVEDIDCVKLISAEATLVAIESNLRESLRKVGPEDRFVLFYKGHMPSLQEQGVIATFDTRCTDVLETSMPLSEMLNRLRKIECRQILLFLDGSHGAFPICSELKTDLDNKFPSEELQIFCKESPKRSVFVSCKPNEVSHPSGSLDHGIWTHCLIQSLKGAAKESMEKDFRMTTRTLQSYLAAEVPRLLRVTVAGAVKQSPVLYGSKVKETLIVDFADRLQKGQPSLAVTSNPIKDSSLIGEMRGRVRELRGYSKPKTSLSTHNDWERDFVEKAGAAEVTAQATEIFEKLREMFRYKRKDLSFTNVASTASIKGPDFDVNICLIQDPDDAERYLLSTEVRSFRNAEAIDDPRFLGIFSKYCKRVVFELAVNLELESKIDDIEEIECLASNLEYDPECTEFTLRMPEAGISIYATETQLVFSLDGPGDLKLLLDNTQKAFSQLSGNRINLGLRD